MASVGAEAKAEARRLLRQYSASYSVGGDSAQSGPVTPRAAEDGAEKLVVGGMESVSSSGVSGLAGAGGEGVHSSSRLPVHGGLRRTDSASSRASTELVELLRSVSVGHRLGVLSSDERGRLKRGILSGMTELPSWASGRLATVEDEPSLSVTTTPKTVASASKSVLGSLLDDDDDDGAVVVAGMPPQGVVGKGVSRRRDAGTDVEGSLAKWPSLSGHVVSKPLTMEPPKPTQRPSSYAVAAATAIDGVPSIWRPRRMSNASDGSRKSAGYVSASSDDAAGFATKLGRPTSLGVDSTAPRHDVKLVKKMINRLVKEGKVSQDDAALLRANLAGAKSKADVRAVEASVAKCARVTPGAAHEIKIEHEERVSRYGNWLRKDVKVKNMLAPRHPIPSPATGSPSDTFGSPRDATRRRRTNSMSSTGTDLSSAAGAGADAASLTIRLHSHYSVSADTADSLTFLDALRGPWPLERPAFLRNKFRPLRPHTLNMLKGKLRSGSQRLMNEPNAGGSSVNSEAISMEMLEVSFGARLELTEMQVRYKTRCSIADYVASLELNRASGTRERTRLGVSVTRAMKYRPGPEAFTVEDAERLLRKKLSGMLDAAKHVDPLHKWDRALLHAWCQSEHVATVVKKTLHSLPAELWSDCLVLCTVCPDMEHVIFRDLADFDKPRDYVPDRYKREQEAARKLESKRWSALVNPRDQ